MLSKSFSIIQDCSLTTKPPAVSFTRPIMRVVETIGEVI